MKKKGLVFPKVSRVEVIDMDGRAYVARYFPSDVKVLLQDDGRTLKISIPHRDLTPKDSPRDTVYQPLWVTESGRFVTASGKRIYVAAIQELIDAVNALNRKMRDLQEQVGGAK